MTLRGHSLGLLSALAIAGSAHAADATPPSPAQSCGPNCRFQAVAFPGGIVELAGSYDCQSATCWNGDAVKLAWDVGAASCLSATATAYDPKSNGAAFHSVQIARPLKADGASFEAGGFQIAGGTALEGFFFRVSCRR